MRVYRVHMHAELLIKNVSAPASKYLQDAVLWKGMHVGRGYARPYICVETRGPDAEAQVQAFVKHMRECYPENTYPDVKFLVTYSEETEVAPS